MNTPTPTPSAQKAVTDLFRAAGPFMRQGGPEGKALEDACLTIAVFLDYERFSRVLEAAFAKHQGDNVVPLIDPPTTRKRGRRPKR